MTDAAPRSAAGPNPGPDECVGPGPSAAPDRRWFLRWVGLGAALLLSAVSSLPATGQALPDPVPDFLVRDVNPNSPRNGKAVSPRDYRLQISAYYFGAAG